VTTAAASLRARAEGLAAPLPPLLAEAQHLAATVMLGTHGRRRAGRGDEFWQYRPAHAGDEARAIDWRRSARSDAHFVREKEWQAAQSVWLWADPGLSMGFSSVRNLPPKGHRARVLALALAILLVRGGERVGLAGPGALRPAAGEAQLDRIADTIAREPGRDDYALPDLSSVKSHGRTMLISDFLTDPAPLIDEISRNTKAGVRGAMLQVLDPQEESFPFRGRTIFRSMGGTVEHETLRAADLRPAYLQRLARRRAELGDLARRSGWLFHTTRTDEPAEASLLWAYRALERRDRW